MANTHTSRYQRHLVGFGMAILSVFTCAQVSAGAAQSRLIVSVTVVDSCNLNLNTSIPSIQLQQFNKLRDTTRALSCEGQRGPVQAGSAQTPIQVSADATNRGVYNIIVDENAGLMTLAF
jgi:hypothetical protein